MMVENSQKPPRHVEVLSHRISRVLKKVISPYKMGPYQL